MEPAVNPFADIPPTEQTTAWAVQLWHLYQTTYDAINARIDGGLDAVIAALANYLTAPMLAMAVVSIACMGLVMAFADDTNFPIQPLFRSLT